MIRTLLLAHRRICSHNTTCCFQKTRSLDGKNRYLLLEILAIIVINNLSVSKR